MLLPFRERREDSRQGHPDLRELPRFRIDLNRTAMLFNDDVVADREAETSALARRLGRKERIENLVFQIRRDAGAIVADADLTLSPRFRVAALRVGSSLPPFTPA